MTSAPLIEPDGLYDAVVIGAGPAGASAALLLARRGLRTLLVERKAFPRDKVCGGCLNSRSLTALEALGLGNLCDRLQAPRTDRLRILRNGRRVELPVTEGRAVSRAALDDAIVQAVVAAGASFQAETHAIVLPESSRTPTPQPRQILLRLQGEERLVSASVVIAADGLGHPSLDRLPEFTPRVARSSRIGLGAVIDDGSGEIPSGTIVMSVGQAGYVGAVRIEDGRLNVAAAVNASFLRQYGPSGAITRLLREAGATPLPEGIAWQGTLPLTRRTPKVAGRGIFLLGDAAGYVEPFTGEGMAWAFEAARRIAPLIEQACHSWKDELARDWEREYACEIRRRQRVCRLVAGVLRRPVVTSLALSAIGTFPAVARPLIRSLETRPCRPGVAT